MLDQLLLSSLVLLTPSAPASDPLAAAPAPTRQAQTQQAETPEDARRPSRGELKREIDVTLRWLRGRQDREGGAYGGVEETAWALRAFLTSHRGYRVSDGPFLSNALSALVARQRPDGSIADADAPAEEVLSQTLTAARTLALIDEEPALTALEGALAYLRVPSIRVEEPPTADVGATRSRARTLLDQRDPEGFWEGYGGRVLATARNTVQLSHYYDVLSAAAPSSDAPTAEPLPGFTPADRQRVTAALARGATFLVENTTEDGLWGALGNTDPGITAMVVGALTSVPEPRPAKVQAAIDRGLATLAGMQRDDGSIHEGTLANYITSAAVLAMVRSGDEAFADEIAAARAFLTELQADEGEGYSPAHRYYGGVGYGGDERPDLSNLQLALEALDAAGLEPDSDAYQKALTFLQRTQNRSESNDLELTVDGERIRPGDDGGSAYAPGESKAGYMTLPDGTKVPRSYGSMTYALLRGYLFAGLDKDDPRVQAAWNWLTENYTLDVNPGFVASDNPAAPYQGLFYYFYSMAKALDMYGQATIVDGAGQSHDWRAELAGRLVAMQRLDGSWVNQNSPRWWEGNPVLATAYAMLSLDAAGGTGPAAGDDHGDDHGGEHGGEHGDDHRGGDHGAEQGE